MTQRSRIKTEAVAQDRRARSHAARPNGFVRVGIETQGVVDRNIVPHRFSFLAGYQQRAGRPSRSSCFIQL